MFLLSRWRIYAGWPYRLAAVALWLVLHQAGVSGALAGIVLASSLPTRPTPAAGPLLAQAATALAELEQAERAVRHAGGEVASLAAGADLGLGQPQPLRRGGAAAVARRTRRARPRAMVDLLRAADVRLHRRRRAADRRSRRAGRLAGDGGRRAGPGDRQAARASWPPPGGRRRRGSASRQTTPPAPPSSARLACAGSAIRSRYCWSSRRSRGSSLAAVAKLGVLVGSVAATGLGVLALSLTPSPETPADPAVEVEAAEAAA